MSELEKRISRRLVSFLSNGKSADRLAAEIVQLVKNEPKQAA